MRTLLDSLSQDFDHEIQQKQTFLDDAHAKLKDKTRELRETRRKLHLLKELCTIFEDLQQTAKNLDRAIQDEESRFYASESINGDAMIFQGPFDADAPMIVKPLGADTEIPLPPTPILAARVMAYKKNNATLRTLMDGLLYQNKLMEDKIKIVVSKCAGVPLENLDALLEALLQAVDSDGPQLDQKELNAFLQSIPRAS
jgi:regulatory protein SWI6